MTIFWKFNLIFLILFLFSCAEQKFIEINGDTMGTSYKIIIIEQSNKIPDTNILHSNIDSLLNNINNLFSTYIKNSELMRFNKRTNTSPFKISNKFADLYEKAINISLLSNGAFDFTVLPLVSLWGFGENFDSTNIPSKIKIDEIMNHTGISNLIFKEGYLSKNNIDVQIDFNAIAKGWAVDQIALFFNNQGIENYMVEIGGEIRVSGFNKLNKAWRLGISNPKEFGSNIYTTINISNQSIATSGTYNNHFFLDDINYSHIINPETGYPIKHDLVSATVIADDCATADAIATAVMVKGFTSGLEWINSLPGIECLLIKENDIGDYIAGKSSGFNY